MSWNETDFEALISKLQIEDAADPAHREQLRKLLLQQTASRPTTPTRRKRSFWLLRRRHHTLPEELQ